MIVSTDVMSVKIVLISTNACIVITVCVMPISIIYTAQKVAGSALQYMLNVRHAMILTV